MKIGNIASLSSGDVASANVMMRQSDGTVAQSTPANFYAGLGVLSQSSANVNSASTSGTAETDLHTLTIAANTLSAVGQTIVWNGGIKTVGGAVTGTNTFNLYLDGVSVLTINFTSMTSVTTGYGAFSLYVQYKASGSCNYIANFNGNRFGGSAFVGAAVDSVGLNMASNFDIKVTGQCAQSDAIMTCLTSRLVFG